ncbi:MAG: hypothetical protein ACXW0J_02800 [Nitrososphaeraceae archaeon]
MTGDLYVISCNEDQRIIYYSRIPRRDIELAQELRVYNRQDDPVEQFLDSYDNMNLLLLELILSVKTVDFIDLLSKHHQCNIHKGNHRFSVGVTKEKTIEAFESVYKRVYSDDWND